MSEKQYSTNPELNEILADTAQRLKVEEGIVIEPTVDVVIDLPVEAREKILEHIASTASEIPPFSIPITDISNTVEVVPGILVSEHLIRDAVAATTEPGVEAQIEAREKARSRMRAELRQDLDASRQVVQSMIERIKNPPNLKEKFISYDAMPSTLQRVVNAYIAAAEANRELDEAIKALAAEPRSTT